MKRDDIVAAKEFEEFDAYHLARLATMGAGGSKPGAQQAKQEAKVPDYYETLGVEESATSDEIKVSGC